MPTDIATEPQDGAPAGEPNLDSFVLRFVQAPQGAALRGGTHWHGVIRHVQSNRERAFNRWGDAVAFISEFVSVEEPKNE